MTCLVLTRQKYADNTCLQNFVPIKAKNWSDAVVQNETMCVCRHCFDNSLLSVTVSTWLHLNQMTLLLLFLQEVCLF